jgi:uncharacterized damage-inducible protein DinB
MIERETAVMLTSYNAWADRTLFEAMSRLPEEALYRESTTLFRSMVGTLNHNYQVDIIWQSHLLGKEHGFGSRRDVVHPRFEDLVKAQREMNNWFLEWAGQQSRETLSEPTSFQFVSGKAGQMRKGAILLHVINHKTYHRGWVSEMFFDAGTKPPETDLSVYLCEGHAGQR